MADVVLRLVVENGQVRVKLDEAQRQFQTFGAQASASVASIGQASKTLTSTLSGVKNELVGLFTIYKGASLAMDTLKIADNYTMLTAKIKLVTGSQQEFAAAEKQVFDIAQRSRSAFEATAELYGRLARSTKDLGVSQSQVLQVTETVVKAIRVSGAGAREAEAAIIQLSQGIASGRLAGDELRSVLEQAPRLGKAIADGLNVPYGKLRDLASQGLITSEKVFAALLKESSIVGAEFAKLPVTMQDGITRMGNAWQRELGRMSQSSGFTSGIGTMLSAMAEDMDKVLSVLMTTAGTVTALFGVKLVQAMQASANATNELVDKQQLETAAALRQAEADTVAAANALQVANAKKQQAMGTAAAAEATTLATKREKEAVAVEAGDMLSSIRGVNAARVVQAERALQVAANERIAAQEMLHAQENAMAYAHTAEEVSAAELELAAATERVTLARRIEAAELQNLGAVRKQVLITNAAAEVEANQAATVASTAHSKAIIEEQVALDGVKLASDNAAAAKLKLAAATTTATVSSREAIAGFLGVQGAASTLRLVIGGLTASLQILFAAFAGWQIGSELEKQSATVRAFGAGMDLALGPVIAVFDTMYESASRFLHLDFKGGFGRIVEGIRDIAGMGGKKGFFFDMANADAPEAPDPYTELMKGWEERAKFLGTNLMSGSPDKAAIERGIQEINATLSLGLEQQESIYKLHNDKSLKTTANYFGARRGLIEGYARIEAEAIDKALKDPGSTLTSKEREGFESQKEISRINTQKKLEQEFQAEKQIKENNAAKLVTLDERRARLAIETIKSTTQADQEATDTLYKAKKISLEDYYATSAALATKSYQDQLAALEKLPSNTVDLADRKRDQIKQLEEAYKSSSENIKQKRLTDEEQIHERQVKLQVDFLNLQGRTAEAKALQDYESVAKTMRQLGADAEALKLRDKILPLAKVQADFTVLEDRIKRINTALEQGRIGIQTRVQSGDLTPEAAREATRQLEIDARSQLTPIVKSLREMAAQYPELLNVQEALNGIGAEITTLGTTVSAPFQNFVNTLHESWSGLVTALQEGNEEISDSFEHMVKGLVSKLEAAMLDRMFTALLDGILRQFGYTYQNGVASVVQGGGGGPPGWRGILSSVVGAIGGYASGYASGSGGGDAATAGTAFSGDGNFSFQEAPVFSQPTFGGHYSKGGLVSGPGGPTDDAIPTMLSSQEFVIKAEIVRRLGARFFHALNSGRMGRMAMGGLAGSPSTYAGGAFAQPSAPVGAPSVSIGDTHIDARGADASAIATLMKVQDARMRALEKQIFEKLERNYR